jgi:hypothetical protein
MTLILIRQTLPADGPDNLLLGPFLVGAHYSLWLLGLAIGIIPGLYFYLRRERYSEPGPDADETRFPR